MRKRCTNSACRKEFYYKNCLPTCPYCGKMYGHNQHNFLLFVPGHEKIKAIKALRTVCPTRTLWELRQLIESNRLLDPQMYPSCNEARLARILSGYGAKIIRLSKKQATALKLPILR